MSMHLRGSRDVMGRDESWWQSRTGLEQKLVILSTVLFILSFSLTISVIVIKNRSPAAPPAATTVEPTGSTASSTVTGDAGSTGSPTVTDAPGSTGSPTVTEAPGSTGSPTVTEAPGSTGSPTVTDAQTTTNETPTEKQLEVAAPGSINNRPARYISPKALANVNGA